MNTSAKGSAYENAYKALLLERGARLVLRSAASKGPFDLFAIYPDSVIGIQCKAGRMSCAMAVRHLDAMPDFTENEVWIQRVVVHRREYREFCEH